MVTYGDHAQTGGTRNTYEGDVDSSTNKTVFNEGDHSGGIRNTST